MKKIKLIAIACAVAGGLVILRLAMPQWFESPWQTKERKARVALRAIHSAEQIYRERYGVYGTIPGLRVEGLLDLHLQDGSVGAGDFRLGLSKNVMRCAFSDGDRDRYFFRVYVRNEIWEAHAEPLEPGADGLYEFSIYHDGGFVKRRIKGASAPRRSSWLTRLLGN